MRSLVLFRGRAYGSLQFERLQCHRRWQDMEPPDDVPCKMESLDVPGILIDAWLVLLKLVSGLPKAALRTLDDRGMGLETYRIWRSLKELYCNKAVRSSVL
jgi:hypothetical protein